MTGITETCFCGRDGDLAEREAVGTLLAPALRCPDCAHVDGLTWLSVAQRRRVWSAALHAAAVPADVSAPRAA